ncbi:MAG: hypothetical protein AAF829_04975 [Pseudomonadota bacterium]
MDQRTVSALQLGWRYVARVLAVLKALPGINTARLEGRVWAQAFAQLRPAESAARRMIVALADGLITSLPPLQAQCHQGRATPRTAPCQPGAPARSAFCLFDTLQVPLGLAGPIHKTDLPIADNGACSQRTSAGLIARCNALEAVLSDPSKAVDRMARWLSKRHRRRSAVLRPGRPPGYRRRAWRTFEMDVLIQCHEAALRVLNTPRGPPQHS